MKNDKCQKTCKDPVTDKLIKGCYINDEYICISKDCLKIIKENLKKNIENKIFPNAKIQQYDYILRKSEDENLICPSNYITTDKK